MEYALEAYRNAGNQRTIAESRYAAETKKAMAGYNKGVVAQGKEKLAGYKTDDAIFEASIRKVDMDHTRGLISGADADVKLAKMFAGRKAELAYRIKELQSYQKQGITKLGGTNISTLVNGYREQIQGKQDDFGNITKAGINDMFSIAAKRASNPGAYSDIVTFKSIQTPLGEEKIYTVERKETPTDTSAYIRDELGRLVPIEKQTNEAGETFFTAYSPYVSKNGNTIVRKITSDAVPENFQSTDQLTWKDEQGNIVQEISELSDKLDKNVYNFGQNDLTPEFISATSKKLSPDDESRWVTPDEASIALQNYQLAKQPQPSAAGELGRKAYETATSGVVGLQGIGERTPIVGQAGRALRRLPEAINYGRAQLGAGKELLFGKNEVAASAKKQLFKEFAPKQAVKTLGKSIVALPKFIKSVFTPPKLPIVVKPPPAPRAFIGPINPANKFETNFGNAIRAWAGGSKAYKGYNFLTFVKKYAKQASLPQIVQTYNKYSKFGRPKETPEQITLAYRSGGGR